MTVLEISGEIDGGQATFRETSAILARSS